jgi:hypothetical protein
MGLLESSQLAGFGREKLSLKIKKSCHFLNEKSQK